MNTLKPSALQPLEKVKATIVDRLKKKKGRELASSTGKQILADLKSAASTLEQKADSLSIKLVDTGYVKRDDTALDSSVINAAFTLEKPVSGQPLFAGVTEVDGDYTIIELSDVKSEYVDSEKAEAIKALVDTEANYEYQAVVKSLTSMADVVRTPEAELQ